MESLQIFHTCNSKKETQQHGYLFGCVWLIRRIPLQNCNPNEYIDVHIVHITNGKLFTSWFKFNSTLFLFRHKFEQTHIQSLFSFFIALKSHSCRHIYTSYLYIFLWKRLAAKRAKELFKASFVWLMQLFPLL